MNNFKKILALSFVFSISMNSWASAQDGSTEDTSAEVTYQDGYPVVICLPSERAFKIGDAEGGVPKRVENWLIEQMVARKCYKKDPKADNGYGLVPSDLDDDGGRTYHVECKPSGRKYKFRLLEEEDRHEISANKAREYCYGKVDNVSYGDSGDVGSEKKSKKRSKNKIVNKKQRIDEQIYTVNKKIKEYRKKYSKYKNGKVTLSDIQDDIIGIQDDIHAASTSLSNIEIEKKDLPKIASSLLDVLSDYSTGNRKVDKAIDWINRIVGFFD